MKLSELQFNKMLERYLETVRKGKVDAPEMDVLKDAYKAAFKKSIEFLEQYTREDQLNLAAIGSDVEATFIEQAAAFKHLCRFLDKTSLTAKDGTEIQFNQELAHTVKALDLDPELPVLESVYIYDAPSNLSIREKYSRGILTASHWLTDLDLQRMLRVTGAASKVTIMPFNSQSIGTALHFARIAHEAREDASAPYTVPFILNRGGEGKEQGVHWIAAKVTVDPLSGKISYQIDDSLALSERQLADYKKRIEEAIKFNDGVHTAYPGGQIQDAESLITGHASQTDGYSCGYRALHHLFQDPTIRGGDEKAQAFAEADAGASANLVRQFYRHQLEDFALPREVFDALSGTARAAFAKPLVDRARSVGIDPGKLGDFISELPKVTPIVPPSSLNPVVDECIGGYRADLTFMRFPPAAAKEVVLDAVQYEAFFQQLSQIDALVSSPLPTFQLARADLLALDGLNAFYAEKADTLFKRLTIDVNLGGEDDVDGFVSRLKSSLSNLSRAHLTHLEINDEKNVLKDKHLSELVKFVSTHHIAFRIDLPKAYQATDFQRQLDKAVAINLRQKNSASLTGTQSEQSTSQDKQKAPKRTRVRQDPRAALKIDIELQEGVEETVVVEKKKKQVQKSTQYGALKVVRLDQLQTAIETDDFAAFKDVSLGLTKKELVSYWHNLFSNKISAGRLKIGTEVSRRDLGEQGVNVDGQVVSVNKQFNGFSDAALARLIEFKDYFQDGINVRELPPGFLLVMDPDNMAQRVLHYDEHLAPQNAISARPITRQPRPALGIDTIDRLLAGVILAKLYARLWQGLGSAVSYSRDDSRIFRQCLPDLMGLTDDQLVIVERLCTKEEPFNFKTLEFIFNNLHTAKTSYTEPYDEKGLVSVAWMAEFFPDVADREAFVGLAHSIRPTPVESHALFILLKADGADAVEANLQRAKATYQLTNQQLNGLLGLYDKYGTAGLEKILATWQTIHDLPCALPSVQAHVGGYEAILLSDNVLSAAKIINGFSAQQRQWWDKLYQAHQPKDDSIANLVKSFTDFSAEMTEKGLSFYDLSKGTHPFTGAGNLPTTLGRISSILRISKEEDRKAQWQAISKIDLSAEMSLRSMTDKLLGEKGGYSFIEEAMELRRASDGPAEGGTPIEKAVRWFYKTIAAEQFRLPLSFYKEQIGLLEQARADGSLPEDAVINLYVLLATATTGDNCRFFIDDIAAAKVQWQAILGDLKSIELPTDNFTIQAKVRASEELRNLTLAPALPVLAKVVKLTTAPLKNVGVFGLPSVPGKMAKFVECNDKLNAFLEEFGNKIYLGMKFYSEADFAKKSSKGLNIFEEHLAVSQAIKEAGVAAELFPLISTFSINTANVTALAEAITDFKQAKGEKAGDDAGLDAAAKLKAEKANAIFREGLLKGAIDLLLVVENRDNLTPAKLTEFITAFNVTAASLRERFDARYKELSDNFASASKAEQSEFMRLSLVKSAMDSGRSLSEFGEMIGQDCEGYLIEFAKADIQAAVEAIFKANFPRNYFENLKAGKAQGQVQLLIEKFFTEESLQRPVHEIRVKYSTAAEEDMQHLIGFLGSITEDLGKADKVAILTQLTDERLLSSSIQEYNHLLTSIDKSGSSSFQYFMRAAGEFGSPVDELALKADYFLSTALPHIRRNKSSVLSEIEIVDLAAGLVLAAKKEELRQEVNIHPKLTELYSILAEAIAGKDVVAIESRLADLKALDSNVGKLGHIVALEEHLAWLKIPETESVEVTVKEMQTRPRTLGLGQRLGNFFGIGKKEATTEDVEVDVKKMVDRPKVKQLGDTVLASAATTIKQQTIEKKSHAYALAQTFTFIEQLVERYPAAKSSLLSLSRHLLTFSASDGTQIEQAFSNLALLNNELMALADQDLVISLCEHFGNEGREDHPFSYKDLLAIIQGKKVSEELNFLNYPLLSQVVKTQVFKVISALLNNDKPCSLKEIETLINRCHDPLHGETYANILEGVFSCAPFPTLDQIEQWFDSAKENPPAEIMAAVMEDYREWNITPVAREKINGFNFDDAKKQAQKMDGVDYTEDELSAIDREVTRVKKLTTDTLRGEITNIGECPAAERPTKLVALMAELLYRTKGLPQVGVGEDREWGRSFEINTTQYLAIHSMLKTGGHVTSQIGTGEGKSRIMMISVACQFALGKTVDFVTSDLSLATRDYLEYQAFFKALGAKTNLIYAHTPASEYRLEGINFSDASNLSLFRNKARSEGDEKWVIAADPTKRSLMLDEADKSYFDSIDTRYNYSAQADPSIRDMEWMYGNLVTFFSDPTNVDLYYNDADGCNDKFHNFVRGLLEPEQMARLVYNPKIPMTVITRNQLEAWQSSALTALALEVDKDFVIKPNVTVQTKEGPKVVSQALLVSGSRASGNAKFSFGVHQCLHARLNELRKSASDDSPTPLTNQLKGLENTFYLDPENQIIYSSTSKDLMDDYEEGELLAVTGTAGSIKEREEAGEQFGSDKGNMAFIDVPRHRGQKREDLPVALAKNEEAQKQKILASVRVSLSKNPPQAILLVCENDTESQALHDFLKKNLSEAKRSKLTRISARTSLDTEAKHVKEGAGLPGAITVSTAMLGRGTDIKLHKAAQMVNGVPSQTLTTSGLSVIGTYLPRERDYEQIIGRAGRFGAVGESRIILDTERVKRQIGADVLPTEFYTATESYLKLQQKHMDTFAQQQRVVKYAVGDFRKALTDQFFDKFYQPLAASGQKDLLLEPWQKFFDKTDKQWNETWPNVVLELAQKPLNVVEVKRLLTEYEDLVKQEWQGMRDALKAQITSGKIVCAEGEAKVDETIPAITTSIHIDDKREARLQSSHRELKEESLRTIVASKYDPAFVGRAVIYTSWLDGVKAFWANIQSARRGETPWFPNLKAYQNGNMSSSQLLFGTWGSPLPSKSTLPDVDLHQKSVPVSVPEELPLTLSTRVLLDKLSCSSSILKKHDVVEDEHDVVEDPIVLETTSDKTPLKQRLSQLKGDLNQNTENDIDQSHY